MKTALRSLTGLLMFGLAVLSCEQPSSPDFETEHQINTPLIQSIEWKLLGGDSGALIDSTSTEFEELFKVDDVDQEDMIRIVSDVDFDMGEFGDVLPSLDIDPVTIDNEIGVIEASFTGQGEADYEEVTGMSPPPPGTLIPAGDATIQIDLEVEDLESAVIEDGGIRVTFENNLGYEISRIVAELQADGTPAGQPVVFENVEHSDTVTGVIHFDSGEELDTPLSVETDLEWEEQTSEAEGENLVISASDEELLVEQITGAVPGQTFFTSGQIQVDDDEFVFASNQDFVEFSDGELVIDDIVNEIDVDIELLRISFPDIRTEGSGNYAESDSLVVKFSGDDMIIRDSNDQPSKTVSMENVRIYAEDNRLVYNVAAETEDTRDASEGDQTRTLSSDNKISMTTDLSGLQIRTVQGVVRSNMINITDEVNGRQDLYEEGAKVTGIDEIRDLADRVSNLQFIDPTLTLTYETNIGVRNVIYGAIMGITDDGEEVLLSGKPGSDHEVASGDPIDNLTKNGAQLDPDQLIRIELEPAEEGATQIRTVTFDRSSTNIDAFMSALPTEIRFVGRTRVNPDEESVSLSIPLEVGTGLGLDIPMNIATPDNPVAYSDTVSADLSDLPDSEDDRRISSASLNINFSNRIPLGVNLNLIFLDGEKQVITAAPREGQDPIVLQAAPVTDQGFASAEQSGRMSLSLNSDQLEQIGRTRHLLLELEMNTTGNTAVKLRASDYLNLGVSGNFELTGGN